jgi:spore protease
MRRTDLAVEAHEIAEESGKIQGIEKSENKMGNTTITKIKVLDENGEKAIGKPKGTYISIEAEGLSTADVDDLGDALNAASAQISELLKPYGNSPVLIVGLGNSECTPDAIGPKAIRSILVTRHMAGELSKMLNIPNLRAVSAISPGVLGQTGIETAEIIRGLVDKTKPSVVIAIDALAARKLSRLGNTLQIADTGISPGSGVGNSRSALNQEALGVPVISIGIPTVVDAATLTIDVMESTGVTPDENKIREVVKPGEYSMMVTPREIDLLVEHASKTIAMAINRALYPELSVDDIESLVG